MLMKKTRKRQAPNKICRR